MSNRSQSGWLAAVVSAVLATAASAAVPPFCGDLPGAEIGSDLPANYEPSGGAWHPRLQRVFLVHDGGTLTHMREDGKDVRNWTVGGDLEGVAIADPMTDLVYLGVEHPDAIKEFDLVSGRVTRTFDLTPWMRGADSAGLEALAFVPDADHPEGGVFYAGHQEEGTVYVFGLPIRSSSTSTTVTYEQTLGPYFGRRDISGLEWDWDEDWVYAIWDSSNIVARLTSAGTLIDEYQLPGNDQEGVAVKPCELFVMEDTGKEVWRYGFPTSSRDEDGDRVIDCDDHCLGTATGVPVDWAGCPHGVACGSDAECDDHDSCTFDRCFGGMCEHETQDGDFDGVADCIDNCEAIANGDQADFDSDGVGDECETLIMASDSDRSGRIDGVDLARLARAFGSGCTGHRYDPTVDIDRDCDVDGDDLAWMASYFGR